MLTALITGVLLGLSSGLAPGPLLALVLSQTLRHGAREGCKIALTPLLTDAPIILLTLFAASRLGEMRPILGLVSIAGGAFVLYLAWDSLRPAPMDSQVPAEPPRSWFKGVLTNLLRRNISSANILTACLEEWNDDIREAGEDHHTRSSVDDPLVAAWYLMEA